ncbi:hypothetical protein Q5752_002326 [Cryptotrichosporon argae]
MASIELGRPLGGHSSTQHAAHAEASNHESHPADSNAARPESQIAPSAAQAPLTDSGARDRSGSEDTAHESPVTADGKTDKESREAARDVRADELGGPSEARMKKAGMANAAAAGAGGAAAGALVAEARTQPQGWREVEVPQKYQLWHGSLKKERAGALKKGAMVFGFITLWLWVCLSIFWGSNYALETYFPRLAVYLVPLDTAAASLLTDAFVNEVAYQQQLSGSVAHLGWTVRDPQDYPNGLDDVRREILGQECWAALVINANATQAWIDALENGDSTYDPTGAIGVYYQSARFYQVILLYFDSLISEFAANPLSTARSNALTYFVDEYQGNETALTTAANVPQAIGTAFSYTIFDLRPIEKGQWAGAAPMEAGLIYFVIFAFYVALFAGQARMKTSLGAKLAFPSMLWFRLAWPVFCYFWMSLAFTTIERAWQIPMYNHLGAAGFVVLWALNFVTIWAAGWAMETVTALVGPMNLPFFLILWIILNITSSFYPIELMNRFYRLLRAMPFYHNIEGYKIICYGTNWNHRLGLHFGVLLAIIGVELVCFPLSLLFERWNSDRDGRRQVQQKAAEKEGA